MTSLEEHLFTTLLDTKEGQEIAYLKLGFSKKRISQKEKFKGIILNNKLSKTA